VQLYYQIAVHGRKDLALAPDEHAGFSMALLRMLAFHPANAPVATAKPPVAAPRSTGGMSASAPAQAVRAESIGAGAAAARAILYKVGAAPAPAKEPAQPAAPEPARVAPAPAPVVTAKPVEPDPVIPPWHDEVPPDDWGNASQAADPAIVPEAVALAVTNEIMANAEFDGDWAKLAGELAPKLGMARMLVENAVLKGVDGGRWQLAIGPAFANHPGCGRDSVQKLKDALSARFGGDIEVALTVEAMEVETPSMLRTRNRNEQLAAARASLENDPVVKAFEREFGATLLTDTIQPLQESR